MSYKIYINGLGIRFKVTRYGAIKTESGYMVYIDKLINRLNIYEFNPKTKRFFVDKRFYFYKGDYIYTPIQFLITLERILKKNLIEYELIYEPSHDGEYIDIEMIDKFTPKNSLQEEAIEHLNRNKDKDLKCLALRTGLGKTVTTIAHIAYIKRRSLIMVNGLEDQWVREILKWTNLTQEDIYIVKGYDSLKFLIENIDKTISPKIIIGSVKTFSLYAHNKLNYEELPEFDNLLNILKVGLRVIDEGHIAFYASYIQNIRLICKRTLVLTATFDVTNKNIKKIFDSVYPPTLRFGENINDKYIELYPVSYDTFNLNKWLYTMRNFYNHSKYEFSLLSPKRLDLLDDIFYRVYNPYIKREYINRRQKGDKLLILVSTVAMCNYILEKVKKEYSDLKSDKYISKSEESVYDENDIIISTVKSSATGKDIKNLITVLQTVSIDSPPLNIQSLGRLRNIEGKVMKFIYFYNRNIQSQVNHHNKRLSIFRDRVKKIIEERVG